MTSEWRATLVAKETSWLSVEHRLAVDAEIGQLRRAAGGRRVSLISADDGMTKLVATLPLAQGVAVFAALHRSAEAARAAGDPRSRGQVMADTLVELVTGQRTAEGVPLRVDLIITDQALFTGPGADEPATVSGYGPVPRPVGP